MKACIEHFNATYYSLEGGTSSSGTTPTGQVGAGVGQQQGSPAAAGEECLSLSATPPLIPGLYMCYSFYNTIYTAGLTGVGGPSGGGVATAGSGAAATSSTTAMPGGSGQVGVASSGKDGFEPLELNYLQLLGEDIELNEIWKEKYEEWLEVEVFGEPKDWDKIIKSPQHFDLKPMEF